MPKQYMLLLLGFLFIVPAASASPDIQHGKKLHEKACQQCHDNSIYTRPDSIIYSLKALNNRVHFCERMARASWTEKDTNDVISYLNNEFYKYGKKN